MGPQLWNMLVADIMHSVLLQGAAALQPISCTWRGTCSKFCRIRAAAVELGSALFTIVIHLCRLCDQSRLVSTANMCMGEYLRKNKYSNAFIQNYLLPMCAAVWSVPNEKVRLPCASLALLLQRYVSVMNSALVGCTFTC